MIRHMADYVLVWAGGGSDDLAKSPHLARIATSVYDDVCPGDPKCRKYGFIDDQRTPTPMMAQSLLYKLHSHKQKPGVLVDESLFREVFTSKYGKVRIYQVLDVSEESKAWVADPANKLCDAPPDDWHCSGQYPPKLRKFIDKRKAFAQLEDFNTKNDESASEYQRKYMQSFD